jgi:hypothetical protein
MASTRVPTLRLLLALLALVPIPAAAAGCGSDSEPATARVGPVAGGEQRTTSDDAADAGVAADRDATAPGAADGDAGTPDAGAPAGAPAGAEAAPGDTPYEGDGDGDSSDDGGGVAGAAPQAGPGSPAAGGEDGAGTGGAAAAPSTPTGGVGPGGAGPGDEDPVAVPAGFVVEDGGASPMRVEVPAFLGIALEVENAEVRPIQVRLRAPGAEAFTVGPGQTVTRTVAGVAPGLYPLEVDGGASGAVVVAAG